MSERPDERRLLEPVQRNALDFVLPTQPLVERCPNTQSVVPVVEIVVLQEFIPVVLPSQLRRASRQPVNDVPQVCQLHLTNTVWKAILAVPPLGLPQRLDDLRHGTFLPELNDAEDDQSHHEGEHRPVDEVTTPATAVPTHAIFLPL